jgi:hypothetical protein
VPVETAECKRGSNLTAVIGIEQEPLVVLDTFAVPSLLATPL